MAYNLNMTYNRSYVYHKLGYNMKKCLNCFTNFIPSASEKGCSIKCKILIGIEKNSNNCWLFKKSTSGPYSKIRWRNKWYSAHRCSYEVFNGPITEGKWVLHTCDTPKCINPEHLFVGTPKDNTRDAIKKGRLPLGEKNVFSTLTDKQIDEMRKLRADGISYARLSRIFNCSMTHVASIIKNKFRIG